LLPFVAQRLETETETETEATLSAICRAVFFFFERKQVLEVLFLVVGVKPRQLFSTRTVP
jgi:hypothetical protein